MVRYAQRLLERTMDSSSRMSDRVHQLVVLLLPRGLCRVEVVAQHLGVDRRTVARRLAEEQPRSACSSTSCGASSSRAT